MFTFLSTFVQRKVAHERLSIHGQSPMSRQGLSWIGQKVEKDQEFLFRRNFIGNAFLSYELSNIIGCAYIISCLMPA